ncbi:hypothetical protein B0A55_12152 [Friedmanniomyces simplex]|uniref:Uncharacterized protein n=1 Tax=Friedmanniomyces simplex TaxID=329884 RepID=A0A4U0W733_9PEZI|nr:hypothetical protein B0A55_12152 [Friedmanniomyces simplex]
MEMKRRDSRRPSEGLRVVTEPAESASDAARPNSPQRARSSEEISPAQSTKRSVSFFDVGGLLEDGAPSWDTRSRATTLVDIGVYGTTAQDFAPHTPEQSRRGSRAFLTDIGGMMSPVGRQGGGSPFARRHSDAQQSLQRHRGAPIGVLGPMLERQETVQSLQDPGGLLGDMSEEEEQQDQSSANDFRKMWPESGKPRNRQDIRGVDGMTDDHRPGTHATAAPRPATSAEAKTPQTAQPTSAQQLGPDDMSLHDPGGLLGDS